MSTKPTALTSDLMTKKARKKAVLRYLHESDMALSTMALFVNMKREGYTFGYKTVQRHLVELKDEGKVEVLEDANRFYVITDAGREWIGVDDHE